MTTVESILFSAEPALFDSAKVGQDHVLINCPFHNEKTPSCSVALDRPVFFCHGCKVSGHLSQLLAQLGVGKESAKVLIERAGLNKPVPPGGRAKLAAKIVTGRNLFRGNFLLDEDVLDPFRQAPKALLRAGFDVKTLRHFEVGVDHSLLRITYPLRNVYGNLIGVSGRALVDAESRYRLYSQSDFELHGYKIPDGYRVEEIKSATLWHGHVTYPFLYETDDTLILVEGFKAAMWVWQAGFHNVVALIGSYLSHAQAELVARVVQNAILFLDNNEAGLKGTLYAGRTLGEYGVRVLCASYPDEREQPDELDASEIQLAIDHSVRYFHWRREHGQRIRERA